MNSDHTFKVVFREHKPFPEICWTNRGSCTYHRIYGYKGPKPYIRYAGITAHLEPQMIDNLHKLMEGRTDNDK